MRLTAKGTQPLKAASLTFCWTILMKRIPLYITWTLLSFNCELLAKILNSDVVRVMKSSLIYSFCKYLIITSESLFRLFLSRLNWVLPTIVQMILLPISFFLTTTSCKGQTFKTSGLQHSTTFLQEYAGDESTLGNLLQ